jgi:chromosome segregation ATPase
MNKSIFTLATAIMLMAGGIFTGCESNQEKVANAQENVRDAKQDLADVKKEAAEDAQNRANDEEWRVFKNDAEAQIRENEAQIARYKDERKTSGKATNVKYSNDLEALEKRNQDLKVRIDSYDRDRSNWESFKREFNHDMQAFGQAFKNLGQKNTK